MNTELNRFLRHAFVPVVAWAVSKGWLPESLQGDVTEMLVLAGSYGLILVLSYLRDRRT